MKRTPCYGECPQYMISIYESGVVIYNGARFVPRTGCFQSNISTKNINYIKLILDEIQFFDLRRNIFQTLRIYLIITSV